MRSTLTVISVLLLAVTVAVPSYAGKTEEEIINSYFKKAEKRHVRKLGWVSGSFAFNSISGADDYNKFTSYESENFPTTSLKSLENAKSFGLEVGFVYNNRFAWSVGGEYWLKLGENQSGSFTYNSLGSNTTVTDLKSEIEVWGLSTGFQYYVSGQPTISNLIKHLAVRLGGSIGYYRADWDLWSDYQNLNLATTNSENTNTTFRGTAPGFSIDLGVDYPLPWHGFAIGADMSYLFLNFKNVAWYNSSDEEIIASYDGTTDNRVNLDLSGIRGNIEIKRFFSW